jgi:hypothetical protein
MLAFQQNTYPLPADDCNESQIMSVDDVYDSSLEPTAMGPCTVGSGGKQDYYGYLCPSLPVCLSET